ncbi:MAG: hypothetical protein M1818_003016 [Claussenomyces sp. TS43310]|nr:MAG: hypothetical protein M1818_003016 [Claussenomyces sp. TS43310]
MEFGRAMGNDEPVTPVFPNSDYCTGVAGVCGILDAILRRGRDGGSYLVDIALNYYSQWLVRSVGVYPPATWAQLWATSGLRPFRHDEGMTALLPPVMGALMRHRAATLFKPQHFEAQPSAALGRRTVTTVRPILRFPAARVRLGYHVSTRGNGVDQPRWPDDLMDEIVK